MNGPVNALALDSSGNLYAGGEFTTAGGSQHWGIARWDAATQSWSRLGNDASLWMSVAALAVDGNGVLYAGGTYFPGAGWASPQSSNGTG